MYCIIVICISYLTEPTASPDGLVVASIGADFAELRWFAPDFEHHNGIIRSYILSFAEQETGNNFTITSTNRRLTVTNLHPFYTYNVTVAAVTVSPGPFSQAVVFRTLQDSKC